MVRSTGECAASESITRRDIYKTLHRTIEKTAMNQDNMQVVVMRLF